MLLCVADISLEAVAVFSSVARACAMAGAAATWVATPELYPTEIRATGHSVCNAVARIGALISPFVVMSSLSIQTIGGVLCATNAIAVLAARLTPETVGSALDTAL